MTVEKNELYNTKETLEMNEEQRALMEKLVEEYNNSYRKFGGAGIRLEIRKTDHYKLLNEWEKTLDSLAAINPDLYTETIGKAKRCITYYKKEFNRGRKILKEIQSNEQMKKVPYWMPVVSCVVFGDDKTDEAYQLVIDPSKDSDILNWILYGEGDDYEMMDKVRAFLSIRGKINLEDIENRQFPVRGLQESFETIAASLQRCISLMDAGVNAMNAMEKTYKIALADSSSTHTLVSEIVKEKMPIASHPNFPNRIKDSVLYSTLFMTEHFNHAKLEI